jgi:hypothetical protein
MIAALQHEVDAVFRKDRRASSGRACHRDPAGKHLRTGGTVQAGMIAVDPFQRVFAQKDRVHVTHQDRDVGVFDFFGELILKRGLRSVLKGQLGIVKKLLFPITKEVGTDAVFSCQRIKILLSFKQFDNEICLKLCRKLSSCF